MVDSENVQDVEDMKKAYYVLSKLQCLLMRNIPDTKAYLSSILDDFFRTKQYYSQVLDDIGKDVQDGTILN